MSEATGKPTGGWKKRYATDQEVVFLRMTETTYPRHLTVAEILKHYKEEEDSGGLGCPWEEMDVYEHKQISFDDHPGTMQDCRNERGAVTRTRDRSFVVRLLEDIECDFEYFHLRGASKQVAREKAAINRRNRIDQLVEWYEEGWRNIAHSISLFNRYSVSRFSTFESAVDYSDHEDIRHELLCEIVSELQEDGFVVDDFEDYRKERQETEARLRLEYQRSRWDTTPKPVYPPSVAYEYRRNLPSRRHRRFLHEQRNRVEPKPPVASQRS